MSLRSGLGFNILNSGKEGTLPGFRREHLGGWGRKRWVEMVEERGERKERETETETESNHFNVMAWLPSLQPPGLHRVVSRVFCLVGFCLLKYP